MSNQHTVKSLLQELADPEGPLGVAELHLRMQTEGCVDPDDGSIADGLEAARKAAAELAAHKDEPMAWHKRWLNYSDKDDVRECIDSYPELQTHMHDAIVTPLYTHPSPPPVSNEPSAAQFDISQLKMETPKVVATGDEVITVRGIVNGHECTATYSANAICSMGQEAMERSCRNSLGSVADRVLK